MKEGVVHEVVPKHIYPEEREESEFVRFELVVYIQT